LPLSLSVVLRISLDVKPSVTLFMKISTTRSATMSL